jgi:phage terminase large subunit
MASKLEREIERQLRPLRESIFAFSAAVGFVPTPHQVQLFTAVQNREPRIAAKSGHGTGKTGGSNVVGGWRGIQHKNATVIVTAPTMEQCRSVWHKSFSKLIAEAPHPLIRALFHCTKTRVVIGGLDTWGIRYRTATRPEDFQGIHDPHLTVIEEEASGIERGIQEAIEGTLTDVGGDSMHVQIGNPNTRDCGFFDSFTIYRHRWHCMTFNSEDSPLVSKDYGRQIASLYGEKSDVYRVRVLGEFPHSDPGCILSIDELQECCNTPLFDALSIRDSEGKAIRQFGMDFARFGGDENVIVRRSGNAVLAIEFYPHTEPQQVIARAFRMQQEAKWKDTDCQYVADAGGIGEGIMYDFTRAGKQLHEFKSNHRSSSPDFDNKITEAWFTFAKKVRESKVKIPNDRILLQQLSTRQYYMTKKGKMIVESKDEYKKRTGQASPDRADAVVMAFYDEGYAEMQSSHSTIRSQAPGKRIWTASNVGQVKSE